MASSRKTIPALWLLLHLLLTHCGCPARACFPCGVPPASPPPVPPASPPPCASPPPPASCPRDTLKLGVCANLLGGLVGVVIGSPPDSQCCPLLEGLADLEVAICLCTAIKANVLGVLKLELPVALSLLLNACGKSVPDGFKCA